MMNCFSKISLLLLAVTLAFGACTSRTQKTVTSLEDFLGSLQEEYAPDTRVSLWRVRVLADEDIRLLGEIESPEAFSAIAEGLRNEFPGVKNELEVLDIPEGGPLVNALVNNSVIHLRRDPSSRTELVTQGLLGMPLRIFKEEEGKSLVQLPDGYIGWANSEGVTRLDAEALSAYRAARKIIYGEQYGFAYSEADQRSLPVSDLVIGNILAIRSETGDFLEVGYPDGRTGYVLKSEVLPASSVFFKEASREDLVQTALPFHGIPYLWGGASAKNLDCSGFMSNVFFMNGIQLPRDADMQSRCGLEVGTEFTPEGLEPGDLLFFGRKATPESKERVTHVGMYTGDGEFIHAAGHRERVSINSMDSSQVHFIESYPDIFVRSVRILGASPEGFTPLYANPMYKAIISKEE
jgi:cell wall-associated NlpC family hydrolase